MVAVVTGASKGLGRATAAALSRAGYRVVVNFNTSQESSEETLQEIEGPSLVVKADVGDPVQVEAMARTAHEQWGRIDVLVNNAGIIRDSLTVRCEEGDWDDVLRTNLKGCFNTVRSFVPYMVFSGGGHVINVSSRSGLHGRAGQPAYSAAKAAVLGLTASLARELGPHRIRVNAVLPGYMETDMGKSSQHSMLKALEDSMLQTLTDPSEVAGFIAYLVGTTSVTGQVFCIDSRVC